MNKTSIEWCDSTWNPITGCTRGCSYCFARRVAERFGKHEHEDSAPYATAVEGEVFPCDFRPTIYPHRLDEPLRRKKPARIFLGSMGDLFDPAFSDEFRLKVLLTVAWAERHTFLLLTKRPDELRRFILAHDYAPHSLASSPLPNLWLGVTAESQAEADERTSLLLDTPAAVRFVSIEPMLGPVDLRLPRWRPTAGVCELDWVIVGGQTGPGAKPLNPEWPQPVVAQCRAAGVPVFVKSNAGLADAPQEFPAGGDAE